MKVVIPVAGAGTRLRPHTYSQPKPLLHVGGRAMLDYLLDPIVKLDPEEVIFVVGYMGEQIRQHIADNYEFKATYIHQDKLLGLGYALNLAIEDIPDGDILVILGDTIVEADLDRFIAAGDNVLGVMQVEDPTRFGIVVTENDRVVDLEEKPEDPKTNLAIIGLYYFKDVNPLKKALKTHVDTGNTTRGEIQFTDALALMAKDGEHLVPFEVSGWFDCGKKETMISTNEHLITTRNQTKSLEGCVLVPPVYVHPTAKVVRSVLGPNVSVSEKTVITNSVITNSLIGRESTIDKMMLDDSLVGHHVTLQGRSRSLNIGDNSELDDDSEA
ncbi:NTP transferase domain-containing protein [candidate division GN15 bacterium]|nr:NTP transferase domain-containing protein [candidate division GN15 bacterium]